MNQRNLDLASNEETEENESFNPTDRQTWRNWLSRNHSSSKGVWLRIQKKNSTKTGIVLEDAVEEALCFGWIDSKLKTVDENSFKLLLTPRKKGSVWSRINKQRIEKLTGQGLMTAAGLQKAEAAQLDGSWTRLEAVYEITLPEDFRNSLAADLAAQKNFEGFSNSVKRQILWWIESAKKTETRQRRIELAMISMAQNRLPFPS